MLLLNCNKLFQSPKRQVLLLDNLLVKTSPTQRATTSFNGHFDIKPVCIESPIESDKKCLKSLMTLPQNEV